MTNLPSRYPRLISRDVRTLCDPNNRSYQFGIYAVGVTISASFSSFLYKYSYALWLGLQSICASGQNLFTSIYISESVYAIIVGMLGLLLVASLIVNMRTYLLSVTARLEERRLKKDDIEEWMHYRQLPRELKLRVQQYIRHKWLATRGIDEKSLRGAFPAELQREIKHQLCLNLVKQVPVFDHMNDLTLDAICERLEPTLYT
uniref:Ion transport domain-containing protein n=1 Tax=Opuntia streptacantha TaxID=393608 RepID=A0A7C9EGZ8_OPUST